MAHKRGNGEGTIRKHKDGRWVWEKITGSKRDKEGNVMYYPVKIEGKKPRPIPDKVIIYAKTHTELLEKIRQRERQEDTNQVPDSAKLTCEEWFKFWLKNYTKDLKPNTLEQYESVFRLYATPSIGPYQLKKLTSDHLRKLYNDMADNKKSLRMRQIVYVVLGKCLQDACNCTPPKISINPNKSIAPIKNPKKEAKFLNPDEQSKLQSILDIKDESKFAFMCVIALSGGLRKGEICALHLSDLDFKENRIHVHRTVDRVKVFGKKNKTEIIESTPKTRSGNRYIDMPESVMIRLKEFLKGKKVLKEEDNVISIEEKLKDTYVFATPNGSPVEPSNFFRAFKQYVSDAGLKDIKIHSLRHSYATRNLEAGISVNVVSEQLGHSKPSITQDIYQHVIPEFKKEAAAKINHLFEKKQAVNENKVVEMKSKKKKV